jgi:predicted nucleotidyltransferase
MNASNTPVCPQDRLQAYVAERQARLQRIRSTLVADERVGAAWLWGSFGRREADELSDLDLWIVMRDAESDAVIKERHAFVARIEPPLITVEAPGIWPDRGAYLLTLYAGDTAPHQVDWYWQAAAAARVPPAAEMLVERLKLPRTEQDPAFPGAPEAPAQSPRQTIAHAVNYFWAMVPIVAKYVARSPHDPGIELWELPAKALADVRAFVSARAASVSGDDVAATTDPDEKLNHLHELVTQMEQLMPKLADLGIPTPPKAVAHQVRKYLALVESTIR